MRQLNRNRSGMFGRVINFGEAHRDRFPETILGCKMFAAVTTAKLRVEALAASPPPTALAAMGGTAWKITARAALVNTLEAIDRTAEAVAIDHPELGPKFHLPREQNSHARSAWIRRLP